MKPNIAKPAKKPLSKAEKVRRRNEVVRIIQLVILLIGIGLCVLCSILFFYTFTLNYETVYDFLLVYQNYTLLIITLVVSLALLLDLILLLIVKAFTRHKKDLMVVYDKRLKFGLQNLADGANKPSTTKTEPSGPRFRALSLIDEGHPSFEARGTDSGLTLASACASFREYAAGTRSLYYSEKTVRAWVSSLCCSRILLLQGMSGTGKTSLPDCFGDWLGRPADVVPVQPTWKERSDLLGYYNEFTGSFSETPLLEALYRAGGTDSVSVIVLDEANIARVEYYFAEFLSLLELPDPNARKLPIASSGMPGDPKRVRDGQLLLPQNAWFVMTANNDDSTFAISDKVYDRAMVLDLDSRAEPFASLPGHRARLSYAGLARLSREACERYSLTRRDKRRIAELDRFLRRELHVSFGNRIMRQVSSFVPCYVACGGSESEALDLILARKVMRKLSSVSPVYVRSKSGELLGLLGNLFGEGGAPECEAAIRRIADSK